MQAEVVYSIFQSRDGKQIGTIMHVCIQGKERAVLQVACRLVVILIKFPIHHVHGTDYYL